MVSFSLEIELRSALVPVGEERSEYVKASAMNYGCYEASMEAVGFEIHCQVELYSTYQFFP